MFVQIVKTPDGAAPLWVREAWVGTALPTVSKRSLQYSVRYDLSVPGSTWKQLFACLFGPKVRGYKVNAKVAVDLLSERNSDAAYWWRENVEHMLTGKQYFVFNEACCEEEPRHR